MLVRQTAMFVISGGLIFFTRRRGDAETASGDAYYCCPCEIWLDDRIDQNQRDAPPRRLPALHITYTEVSSSPKCSASPRLRVKRKKETFIRSRLALARARGEVMLASRGPT